MLSNRKFSLFVLEENPLGLNLWDVLFDMSCGYFVRMKTNIGKYLIRRCDFRLTIIEVNSRGYLIFFSAVRRD